MTASEAESAARNAAARCRTLALDPQFYRAGDHAEIIATGEVHRVYGAYVGPASGQWLYCIDGQHLYANELRPVPTSLAVRP